MSFASDLNFVFGILFSGFIVESKQRHPIRTAVAPSLQLCCQSFCRSWQQNVFCFQSSDYAFGNDLIWITHLTCHRIVNSDCSLICCFRRFSTSSIKPSLFASMFFAACSYFFQASSRLVSRLRFSRSSFNFSGRLPARRALRRVSLI